jgi:hypothetical protein
MRVTQERMHDGYVKPWWWGLAYQDFLTNCFVIYPIPMNLIVRWSRDLFFLVKGYTLRGYRERIEKLAFVRGHQEGAASERRAWEAGFVNPKITPQWIEDEVQRRTKEKLERFFGALKG